MSPNLRTLAIVEDTLTYLEHPIPVALVPAPGQVLLQDVLVAHATWVKASKEIAGLMLMTMVLELQNNLEQLGVYAMLQELKNMFSHQAEQELLQTVRAFCACKHEEGQSESSYVLKMKRYIDNFECLGHPMSLNLATLPKKDDAHVLHAIRAGKTKLTYALAYASKTKIPPPPNKDNPSKDAICHQCGEGLKRSRKLKPGALNLYVGNGHRAAVEAFGNFHLFLPSGLVVVLNNFHFAPSIKRGIILVLRLYDNGYVNRFENNGISVSKNNLFYFHAISRDGIYEIDLHDSNTNDSSIKMAHKPYSHQVERAKDLRGLIHIDLLKHKHEVFETFKVFQNEVENQLSKTIKSLRYDRGGEYISQEFLDHLKEHRIIAHHTLSYTPQHNGVSERMNRTLLDLVRSMMSQTTLLKSFWDYDLESTARILNMVPTKKVEKTPYELDVMNVEMQSMKENQVWDLVDLPPNSETKIDVKTAFLNGHLYKEVYMVQLEGFVNPKHPNQICKLKRSIYGLKQASGQWKKWFDDEIKKFGFTQNRNEPCVYMKASRSNVIVLILCVDDILIMGNHILMLQDVKSYLGKCFAVKDLGEAAYVLGIKIYRDRSRRLISLCQSAYIEKILKIFNMENFKRGSAVDKKNTKQSILATSSAKGEYIAALDASKDAIWIRKFISGLGVVPTNKVPMKMYCYNTGPITIANEPRITKGARHYRIKVHYLHKVIELGDIVLEKIYTDDNVADLLPKALPFNKRSEHTRSI
ncbi:retrotransposon protein, putative, ty1-copia subclass, partial [Tanacetum coccineum]